MSGPWEAYGGAADSVPAVPAGNAGKPWEAYASAQGPAQGPAQGGRAKIDAYLAETDQMLGLPEGMSARQIQQESGFNPQAFNKGSQAAGLAQVIPATLASLSKRMGRPLDPYNPDDAVLMHRELMRENLGKYGNPRDALKAYNSGWRPEKWDNPETNKYVQAIAGDGTYYERLAQNTRRIGKELHNLPPGAIRGAGGIGATLLAPFDYAARKLGVENSIIGRTDRPEAMTAQLADQGADPESTAFGGAKLLTEVGGTMGAGGGLAGAITKFAPRVAAMMPNALLALRSSGMNGGRTAAAIEGGTAPGILRAGALRAGGGAVAGGTAATMVDPDQAAAGAVIGGVLPPALQVVGGAARLAGAGARAVMRPPEVSGAMDVAQKLGIDVSKPNELAALVAQLRAAETLVPGSRPTVAQALMRPEASLMERIVSESPGGMRLQNNKLLQQRARVDSLEGVAPVGASGFPAAQNDLGKSIARRVIPEEAEISRRVSGMYRAVDPEEASRIRLPVKDMKGVREKYLGPGSFGQGSDAEQAIAAASNLSKGAPETVVTRKLVPGTGAAKWMMQDVESQVPTEALATWRETQRLRRDLGSAISKAKLAGNGSEEAALVGVKRSLDSTIERLAAGGGVDGEHFTAEMAAAWKDANASHATKMQRFHTGPQASIFRTSPNGEPAVQGGEVAAKFWGAGPGAADDVRAFRRLVDDNPDMLGQFRSMVTTEGRGTAEKAGSGALSLNFARWVEQHLPALEQAFEPGEVQMLQRIGADIKRAATAADLGMAKGSPTYQNTANALNLGFLDRPGVTTAATRIPYLRGLGAPLLEGMRGTLRNAKAERMAGVLADSGEAANALQKLIDTLPGGSITDNQLLQLLGRAGVRAAPVLVPASNR